MTQPTLQFHHRYIPSAALLAADHPRRTLLLLHGTGGDENDLLELGALLDPAANLLSPRGQVLEQGMPRFFRRLAEGIFDEADLIQRTGELADFVVAAAGTYQFDVAQVYAVGFSNGANIAASLLLLRRTTLAGAVLFHAMVPLRPETLPDLAGRPVLLSAGEHDPIIPRTNTEELRQLLSNAGAAVTLRWWPGGHSLSLPEVESARDWLAQLGEQHATNA